MTISDSISIGSLIVSMGSVLVAIAGAFYAYKAYSAAKEIAFPSKNAHLKTQLITPFSDELISLNKFISQNIDRKVYLNFRVESHQADFEEYTYPEGGSKTTTLSVWLECFEPLNEGEEPSIAKCSSLCLTFDGNVDKHIFWDIGSHLVKGYFNIIGHGMKQGHYGAVLVPVKIS
ncbi:hypothetical protein SMQE08_14320 [Serratia marcescens]|nr:hypothetical protein SMQE08_14320 [Serratia marcescens]